MSTTTPFDCLLATKPLKFVAPLRGEKVDTVPPGAEYIGLEQMESWTGRLSGVELQQHPEAGANVFRQGDVLFGKLRPYLAKAWDADRGGFCTSESLVLRPLDSDPRFVRYCLLTPEFVEAVNGSTYGSKMPRADWAFIGTVHVPCPSRACQERIANFLDEQTARIDALIAEKEMLVAALLEEEQACIDKAILGGQTPSSQFPFTPDTADVAGAAWVRCALKRHWTVTDCKHLTVEFVDDGVPLASIREVSGGALDLSAAKRATEGDYETLIEGGRRPVRGDLIYVRNASVGAAAFVDTDDRFAMGQDVCLIRSDHADQQFLRLQLMSSPLKAQLESLLVGATIRRINVEQVRNFTLLVPPLLVQQRVVKKVALELDARVALRTHISSHIEQLREYRSSLISAAVTGQLDIGRFDAAG